MCAKPLFVYGRDPAEKPEISIGFSSIYPYMGVAKTAEKCYDIYISISMIA